MEIFRQWGVEDAIRDRGLPDSSDSFVVMDGIEHEIGRSEPEAFFDQGPARKSVVAQDAVEEALARKLAEYPLVEVQWHTRALLVEETGDRVFVTVRNEETGVEDRWSSAYVVGADGGAGLTADAAGIGYEGPPVMGLMLNTYFQADLGSYASARNAAVLMMRPERAGDEFVQLLNTNGVDRWLMLTQIGRATDERSRRLTEDETMAVVRRALRLPDLKAKIINEGVWRLTRRVAERFSKGRIFLAGDAAHRFPPSGGFGLNSGVQDVHNLAWKLAFVINRGVSAKLLESYDEERRPIAHANADLALLNHARLIRVREAVLSGNAEKLKFWLIDLEAHINSVGHTLGFVYDKGIVVTDGTTRPAVTPRVYVPTDRPGSRYPHFWLDDAHKHSSLDLFDTELTIVVGPEGEAWAHAASAVSVASGVPIAVHRLSAVDPGRGLGMGPKGAVLVRPDGVVAWRIGWDEERPVEVLGSIVEQLFG